MKRDAYIFFVLALFSITVGLVDMYGSVSQVAQIMSLVFLTLAAAAYFIVKPLPH